MPPLYVITAHGANCLTKWRPEIVPIRELWMILRDDLHEIVLCGKIISLDVYMCMCDTG